jgi:hypothetical protein
MRTRNVKIISNETLIKQKSNSENVFFLKKQNLLQTETLKKKGKKIKKKILACNRKIESRKSFIVLLESSIATSAMNSAANCSICTCRERERERER